MFTAASKTVMDNTKWSPRRAEPGQWLLKGLVKCGVCVSAPAPTGCLSGTADGTFTTTAAITTRSAPAAPSALSGAQHPAGALDDYVFDRIRTALLDPDSLLAGEEAVAARTAAPDDELLSAELSRLDRKITAVDDERRRIADLYQASLLALPRCNAPPAMSSTAAQS
jgi:hypothetical protein